MSIEIQDEESWLISTKRRQVKNFGIPYSGQEYSQDTNFSSVMGQVVESAATKIISRGFDQGLADSIRPDFDKVTTFISKCLKQIPPTKKTFSHSLLHPIYTDAMFHPDTEEAIQNLTRISDNSFGTDFENLFLHLMVQGVSETDSLPSRTRYHLDALLMIARLASDRDTLMILNSLGNLVPDITFKRTQVDGLFLRPNLNVPNFSNGSDKHDFLLENSREPDFTRYRSEIPRVLDCGFLEIKALFRARWVAQRPALNKPKEYHITNVYNQLRLIAGDSDFALAPKVIVLLYLGGLQPTGVHLIRPNPHFWESRANEAEEAIVHGPENDEIFYRDAWKMLSLALCLREEEEQREKRTAASPNQLIESKTENARQLPLPKRLKKAD